MKQQTKLLNKLNKMDKNNVVKVKVVDENADEVLRTFLGGRSDMFVYYPKDELEKISVSVEKLGEALKAYKESGINWRVFNKYLRGVGCSQSEIDNVMAGAEQFFKDLGMKF